MMGDNRHNSEDARYWGYVPFDHVVGKPVLIWFSIDAQDPRNPKGLLSRIRWDRLFTTVHGEGKRTSYLYPVLGLIALLFVFSFFKKKKVVN
jgi:signal peptidase I